MDIKEKIQNQLAEIRNNLNRLMTEIDPVIPQDKTNLSPEEKEELDWHMSAISETMEGKSMANKDIIESSPIAQQIAQTQLIVEVVMRLHKKIYPRIKENMSDNIRDFYEKTKIMTPSKLPEMALYMKELIQHGPETFEIIKTNCRYHTFPDGFETWFFKSSKKI